MKIIAFGALILVLLTSYWAMANITAVQSWCTDGYFYLSINSDNIDTHFKENCKELSGSSFKTNLQISQSVKSIQPFGNTFQFIIKHMYSNYSESLKNQTLPTKVSYTIISESCDGKSFFTVSRAVPNFSDWDSMADKHCSFLSPSARNFESDIQLDGVYSNSENLTAKQFQSTLLKK